MPLYGCVFARATSLAARTSLVAALLTPFPAIAGLSGHVTSHLTAEPLADVRVSISMLDIPFSTIEIGSAVTDADGFYEWTDDCPFYFCSVAVDHPPYLPAGDSFDWDETDVVIDFALITPATASGTVRFPDGDTSGINVAAQHYLDDVGIWSEVSAANLDADGHFVIGALPPDTYRFCTSYAQDGAIRQCFDHVDMPPTAVEPDATLVSIAEGSAHAGIDFDLTYGGTLSGTIRDGYLDAPPNMSAQVTAYDVDGNWLLSTTSDATGVFHLRGLPDGSFYLGIHIGGPYADAIQFYPGIVCNAKSCPPPTSGTLLTIANGNEIENLDFTVHPDVVVKGRVLDADTGDGLGGIDVGIYYGFDGTALTISDAGTGDYVFYAYADLPIEVGAFDAPPRIDSVYPGASCIGGYCVGEMTAISGATGSVLSAVDIPMALGAVLSGRILRADNGSPGDALIDVFDADFNVIWQGGSYESAYATDAWLPGTYYVEAFAAYPLEGCAFFDDRPCPEGGGDPAGVDPTPVNVVAGEIRTGIDFHFSAVDEVFANGFDY